MCALKRGANWATQEDEALCIAWLNTSQDASVGINQRATTLYDRVYQHFLAICTEKQIPGNPDLRAPKGIEARWHYISKMVSKFAGCLAQIENRCQSGASPEDMLKLAIALFSNKEKTAFALMHCYMILQSAPKWQQYHSVKTSPNPKRAATESVDLAQHETSVTDAVPSCSSRPIRQKASKVQKLCKENRAGVEMAKASYLLASAAKERLAYSKQKTLALSRIANHSIMSMKLDCLNETAKEYYLLEQRRIQSETRESACNELEARPETLDNDEKVDVAEDVAGTVGDTDTDDCIEYDPDMTAEYTTEFLEGIDSNDDS